MTILCTFSREIIDSEILSCQETIKLSQNTYSSQIVLLFTQCLLKKCCLCSSQSDNHLFFNSSQNLKILLYIQYFYDYNKLI